MKLVSDQHFQWFAYTGIIGMCVGWGIRELVLLRRYRGGSPEAHDQLFGSIMGLVIIAIGVVGLVKYHQGW